MMVKFNNLSIVVDGQIEPTYADFIVMSWVQRQGYGLPHTDLHARPDCAFVVDFFLKRRPVAQTSSDDVIFWYLISLYVGNS